MQPTVRHHPTYIAYFDSENGDLRLDPLDSNMKNIESQKIIIETRVIDPKHARIALQILDDLNSSLLSFNNDIGFYDMKDTIFGDSLCRSMNPDRVKMQWAKHRSSFEALAGSYMATL